MSAASAMIQYTLKGSQLDNWFIKTLILHIIFCKMYLKQNVADFVKRIRFVLLTCRELLADLWSRHWQSEPAWKTLFFLYFYRKQQTLSKKHVNEITKRAKPQMSREHVLWGSSRWGCRCRQWWGEGWWTGTPRRISCTWVAQQYIENTSADHLPESVQWCHGSRKPTSAPILRMSNLNS